jgi:hypothetical protein
VYEGKGITPGAFAQVWYVNVSERRGVVDKVLVIDAVAR